MKKMEVTIVIPAVRPIEQSNIVQSFLASEMRHALFVQFVYLTNARVIGEREPSEIYGDETHEVLHVAHDRYFGSCEENIYRTQDFVSLFKPYVFCVGEHDAIDWPALADALDFFRLRRLEAMGWNILVKQRKEDGSYINKLSISALDDDSIANSYVKILLGGKTLAASIAYPAMLSVYGPIDWAAYIGNHLFTREAYAKILHYKFTENVYSFVYKQAEFFHAHTCNYGFYMIPVIHRISEDFIKARNGGHSGWLVDHRTVHGGSPTFWVANLMHLAQIENPALFDAITHSFIFSHVPGENEEVLYRRYSMLAMLYDWGSAVMRHKLEGKSYYFPHAASGSLQDLRYVRLYFGKLMEAMKRAPDYYEKPPQALVSHVEQSMRFLSDYLDMIPGPEELLKAALDHLAAAHSHLSGDQLVSWNRASFRRLLEAPSRRA